MTSPGVFLINPVCLTLLVVARGVRSPIWPHTVFCLPPAKKCGAHLRSRAPPLFPPRFSRGPPPVFFLVAPLFLSRPGEPWVGPQIGAPQFDPGPIFGAPHIGFRGSVPRNTVVSPALPLVTIYFVAGPPRQNVGPLSFSPNVYFQDGARPGQNVQIGPPG